MQPFVADFDLYFPSSSSDISFLAIVCPLLHALLFDKLRKGSIPNNYCKCSESIYYFLNWNFQYMAYDMVY